MAALADTLRELGELEIAISSLRKALSLRPKNAGWHYALGLNLKEHERPDEAVSSFQEALSIHPGHRLAQAELDSLEAAGRAGATAKKRSKSVALMIDAPFHYAILKPVFDELAGQVPVLLSVDRRQIRQFEPDIVLVSNIPGDFARIRIPDATYVYTRHGFASKNYGHFCARLCDYVCVSSEAISQSFVAEGAVPAESVWVTGYPHMDPLFRGDPLPTEAEIPPAGPVVLFAPTYDPLLSAAPVLGEQAVKRIRGTRDDIFVVIKPHPRTFRDNPAWIAAWQKEANELPAAHLVTDPGADILPYLKRADLMVSDTSSVIFEYLALDRPVVLVTNPEHRQEPYNYDPQGIEWQWRDLGEEVANVDELWKSVHQGLSDPAGRSQQRGKYRDTLFGGYADGKAARRIAEQLMKL